VLGALEESVGKKERLAARAMQVYQLYVLLPLWTIPGFGDYLCHRRSKIESTSGTQESITHARSLSVAFRNERIDVGHWSRGTFAVRAGRPVAAVASQDRAATDPVMGRFSRPLPGYEASERRKNTMAGLVWAIIVILFVFWLLGFALHFGGGLIHLVLVVVVILVVYNLLTGRGARV
jgi:hypothetical protein